YFIRECVGEGAGFEITDTQASREGEARRDWKAQVRHFREPGPFATENVPHCGRAVGPAIAKRVDPPFERRHCPVLGDPYQERRLVAGARRLVRNGRRIFTREAGMTELARVSARRP